MIRGLREVDGEIFDENNLFYESEGQYIQTSYLGFCGCGRPWGNLEYLRNALSLLKSGRWDEVGYTHEGWDAQVLKVHGNLKSAYFFWYWADKEELTEHGGSVPGWLTPKGEELLEALTRVCAEEKDED